MSDKRYKRKVYLEDKPRKQAVEELLQAFQPERKYEWISPQEALGRITAEPVFAKSSMPHYHASAMDGIAVVAEKTYSAHEKNPLILVEHEDFMYVDTGNPVISPYNAVIMIEHVEELGDGRVEIIEPASPWQHIRPIGEDIVQEEMLFPQGHQVRPVDIGAMLAAQVREIAVVKRPVVTIIPTGNELVSPGNEAKQGNIIEFNGSVFSSFIKEWGGNPILSEIVPDQPALLKEALLKAAVHSDFVVINAGSSAGSKDYTVHILQELGQVFTHGVATRPGKPVILGKVGNTVVIGMPGYPVSAYLALEWFARPLICKYLGIAEPKREKLKVKLGRRVVSTMGAEDFIRVNIGYVDGNYFATPLTRAAGVTMSLVRADALLVVPPEILGYEQGEYAEVELLKPLDEITTSYIFNGSHDLSIDLLGSHLKRMDPQTKVVSTHTGSMAGIMALKKGEAHAAGIHLLDPDTNEYNIPYLKKLLGKEDYVLLPFLKRQQGWIVPKGNPLCIQTVRDIAKQGAMYVNRQKGAGTRILFDLLLKQENLKPNDIQGYNREYFSHLSVAAEVKGDPQAVGLGVYSAAKAMGVDFIPVADESYDLLMKRAFFESNKGQRILSIIQSQAFIQEVEALGGYKVVRDIQPIYLKEM